MNTMLSLEELISAARGEVEVDILLDGADLINTLSGERYRSDVAIYKGMVVGFDCMSAASVLDLDGKILSPGFIDGHVHIESSMVTVPEFARAVVPRGTTGVVADPHEIANVMGEPGVRYMMESSKGVPLDVYIMLPSCVPATSMETSGATLDATALSKSMDDNRVLGLAEMMNYPGVVHRDPFVMDKIRMASGRIIDGHCPMLSGRDLAAYVSAGIRSDHECTSTAEAIEKLRMGMYIMVREGTAAKNLDCLLQAVTDNNYSRFMFVSDDRNASDILFEGHLDCMLKKAVELGLDPITAIRMATINVADHFNIPNIGAIAPGYRADIAVLDDLESMNVSLVLKDGNTVAQNGKIAVDIPKAPPVNMRYMNVAPFNVDSFKINAKPGMARVIKVVPSQIVTESLSLKPKIVNKEVVSDTTTDVLKIAVVERHKATGNIGLGLVSGFGLKAGALATSVAHDSHNIAVVGVSSSDMFEAVKTVIEMGGGLAAVNGPEKTSLPLPIAGLLFDKGMADVAWAMNGLLNFASALGSPLKDPFMALSFLALPVIPELKITDKGLFDVSSFKFMQLFTSADGIRSDDEGQIV